MDLEPKSEIVFDDQYDREVKVRGIDVYSLIELMKAGAEPINKGQGWTVEKYDIDGFREIIPIDEIVINQIRAFGIVGISRNATSQVLKLRGRGS